MALHPQFLEHVIPEVNKVKWSTDNASMIATQNRQRAYNNVPNELFVNCCYGYLNLVWIYQKNAGWIKAGDKCQLPEIRLVSLMV